MTRGRVLVVEDDASVRLMVRTLLEHVGYDVTTTDTGCRAVSLLADEDYDMILAEGTMSNMVVDLAMAEAESWVSH